MNQYDFNILSPAEFEEFTKDILSAHYNIDLESFAEGKDGGIDLRYASVKESAGEIVQCKRYKNATYLYRDLKKEKLKIDRMLNKPTKYRLVTSVELSVDMVDKIHRLFDPYIMSKADIIRPKQLNSMLHRHPEIERRHYKLWIGSSNVLQNILQSRVTNYTHLIKEDIVETLRLYSPTPSYDEALLTLRKNGFLIIAGQPGVGKTTLADVMSWNLLGTGDFDELIALPADINDAISLMSQDPEKKQLFLFDDFLGSNFLDYKLTRREDTVFKTLIKYTQRLKKTKALIMTTREYILHQAQQSAEVFKDDQFLGAKYVVDLNKYDNVTKASILYNHVAASDLPAKYLNYFIENKVYQRIIRHRNYSPRLIASVNSQNIWMDKSPEEFSDKFIEVFEKPWAIYEDIFENKIGQIERDVLLVLMTIGQSVEFQYLHRAVVEFEPSCNETVLRKALDVLDGTFIATSKNSDDKIVVDFFNPTINDFLVQYYKDKFYTLEKIVRCSIYINQLTRIFDLNGTWKHPFRSYGIEADIYVTEKIICNEALKSAIQRKIIDHRATMNWINGESVAVPYDSDIFFAASMLMADHIASDEIYDAAAKDILEKLSKDVSPTKYIQDALGVFEYEIGDKLSDPVTRSNYVKSVAQSVKSYDDLEELWGFGEMVNHKGLAHEITSLLEGEEYIEEIFVEEIQGRLGDGDSIDSVIDNLRDGANAYGLGESFIESVAYDYLEPSDDDISNFYERDIEASNHSQPVASEYETINSMFASLKS